MNDFDKRLERTVDAVWAVLRQRAEGEASREGADSLKGHRGRRPYDPKLGGRPNLERRHVPIPRTSSDWHTISNADFARAVRQYLDDKLSEPKR
jgi:hypothetical protein